MDRVFDRAFNKAHGTATAVMGTAAAAAEQQQRRQQKSREAQLRECATPMTAEDVVERIGLAYKDKDFFRLLQLPGPALDDLGRAVWPVSSTEVNKAYRKLSLLVHPDKAPGPEARQAFEQLKQAYNELKDPDKLAAKLREAEPTLQRAAERAAAAASVTDRVELNAAAEERKAKLRQEEAKSFQQEIQKQMQQRATQAALRKQRMQASRYRRDGSESDSDGQPAGAARPPPGRQEEQHGVDTAAGSRTGRESPQGGRSSSDDDDDDEVRRSALSKRKKKPRYM